MHHIILEQMNSGHRIGIKEIKEKIQKLVVKRACYREDLKVTLQCSKRQIKEEPWAEAREKCVEGMGARKQRERSICCNEESSNWQKGLDG
ncbi:hypothetical protein Trydic_g7016 [Trypoxylus dichotomus]